MAYAAIHHFHLYGLISVSKLGEDPNSAPRKILHRDWQAFFRPLLNHTCNTRAPDRYIFLLSDLACCHKPHSERQTLI